MSSPLDTATSFRDRAFDGLDLADERIVGKEFDGCRFISCNLQRALLDRCRFVACEFRSSDLSLMTPRDSSFRDVEFVDSKLTGVDWTRAETTLGLDVGFERSVLDGGSFMDLALPGMRMVRCRAEEVSFVGTALSESDFTGTSLLNSRFSGSDLRGADLSGASSVAFDPRECRLEGTRLSLEDALGILGRLGVVVPDLE